MPSQMGEVVAIVKNVSQRRLLWHYDQLAQLHKQNEQMLKHMSGSQREIALMQKTIMNSTKTIEFLVKEVLELKSKVSSSEEAIKSM